MPVEITVRHTEMPEDINAYARASGMGLREEFPQIEHIHVIMDVEKHRHIAEFIVQANHHIHAEAKHESDNMRISIDACEDKIRRQLRKIMDKIHDHKPVMKHVEKDKIVSEEPAN